LGCGEMSSKPQRHSRNPSESSIRRSEVVYRGLSMLLGGVWVSTAFLVLLGWVSPTMEQGVRDIVGVILMSFGVFFTLQGVKEE